MTLTADIELLPADGAIHQLFILLHEAGDSPAAMLGLAEALRAAFPQAAIRIPAGAQPGDNDAGRHWYARAGDDDCNRGEHVARALPALVQYVRASQARFGLLQTDTALAGFGQGATLALEAVSAHDGLAGRVLAFSGCYAELPHWAPLYTTIHLLHGAADSVVPVDHARRAQARLSTLHGDATIDVAARVGHSLHPALIGRAVVRLQTCVPLRSWEAALGLNQAAPTGTILH